MNFALCGLRDGRERKEDIVWYRIELKISHSLSLDFSRGTCVKTLYLRRWWETRSWSLFCRGPPRSLVQSWLCFPLSRSLSHLALCAGDSVFWFSLAFFFFARMHILVLYACGSSTGPVPSPEAHRFDWGHEGDKKTNTKKKKEPSGWFGDMRF